MSVASWDVVGALTAPASRTNAGSSDLLEDQLFAFGCGSGIVVAEAQQLQLAAVLQGGHRGATVTAVKWSPDSSHSRDLKAGSHLRLASGDSMGQVLVWDVATRSVLSRLEDSARPPGGAGGGAGGGGAGGNSGGLGAMMPTATGGSSAGSSAGAGAVALARGLVSGAGTGTGGGGGGGGAGGGPPPVGGVLPGQVVGLEWVLSQPSLLAVLLYPATLLLWDPKGGAVVWRRDLSTSESLTSLSVDPMDRRRLAVCGSAGLLALLNLPAAQAGEVSIRQYRVNLGGAAGPDTKDKALATGGTFCAFFCHARDMLFVLLSRELLVFDLELGVPAATVSLGPSRPSFASLLGVYGRGVTQGCGDDGGADVVYATHVDGGLSIWLRMPGELRYSLSCWARLMPPVIRGVPSQVSLLAARAVIWKQDVNVDELMLRPCLGGSEGVTRRLASDLLPDRVAPDTSGGGGGGGGGGGSQAGGRSGRSGGGGGPATAPGPKETAAGVPGVNVSEQSLLIVSVTSDGRLWQWDAPLPRFWDRSLISSPAETPLMAVAGALSPAARAEASALPAAQPQLVGMLHGLPHSITAIAIFPRPVLVPSSGLGGSGDQHSTQPEAPHLAFQAGRQAQEVVLLAAAVTAAGNLEVLTMRRGQVAPLSIEVALSLSVHRDALVKAVRWIGSTPRLVTWSSSRGVGAAAGGQAGGAAAPGGGGGGAGGAAGGLQGAGGGPGGGVLYRNVLAITDIRTRRTTLFRESAPEPHPVVGMRVSPSGHHLLLLLKDAPCELWAVGVERPVRLRLLDLPFTAVDWVQPTEPQAVLPPVSLTQFTPGTDAAQDPGTPRQSGVPAAASGQVSPSSPGGASQEGSTHPGRGGGEPSAVTARQAAIQAASSVCPEEALSYSLGGGSRVGCLLVQGARVTPDRSLRPPMVGDHEPLQVFGRSIAAWGRTVIIGDADGGLTVWDTATGRCTTTPTGFGAVRWIRIGPPPHPSLYSPADAGRAAATIRARVACLFDDQSFGVYELDSAGVSGGGLRLRAGHASPLTTQRVGKVVDVAWTPLPWVHGVGASGSVLAAVTREGGLVLLDAAQASDRRPSAPSRASALRSLLQEQVTLPPPAPAPAPNQLLVQPLSSPTAAVGTGADLATAVEAASSQRVSGAGATASTLFLAPPTPVSSTLLLLRRPWVLLLRLLLQLGVPLDTLLALASRQEPVAGQRAGQPSDPHNSGSPPRPQPNSADAGADTPGLTDQQQKRNTTGQSAQQVQVVVEGEAELVEDLLSVMPPAVHGALLRALPAHLSATSSPTEVHTAGVGSWEVGESAAPGPQGSQQHQSGGGAGSQAVSKMEEAAVWSQGGGSSSEPPGAPVQQEQAPQVQGQQQQQDGSEEESDMSRFNPLMRAVTDAFKLMSSTVRSSGTPAGQQLPPGSPVQGAGLSEAGGVDMTLAGSTNRSSARTSLHQQHHHHHQPCFKGDLLGCLRYLARNRAGGRLLHPPEWRAYAAALALAQGQQPVAVPAAKHKEGSPADAHVMAVTERMALAARVSGDAQERRFWTHLPSTLQGVRDLRAQQESSWRLSEGPLMTSLLTHPSTGAQAPGRPSLVTPPEAPPPPLRSLPAAGGGAQAPGRGSLDGAAGLAAGGPGSLHHQGESGGHVLKQAARGRSVHLWDEDLALAEAQERTVWHEALSRSVFSSSEELQERRMMEYVVLGDFQTAVAFLLASAPERSARYYRDALITAVLAAAANPRPGGGARQLGTPLQVQAAKVLSAHASSMGDPLLGVPLHCAAGLYAEAVAVLQECGHWRYAANLTAHALAEQERAVALQRWASHVLTEEGSVWRAAGILTSAGCCQEALQVLLDAGLPDCASAYAAACQAAGLIQHVTAPAGAAPASPPLQGGSAPGGSDAEVEHLLANTLGAGPQHTVLYSVLGPAPYKAGAGVGPQLGGHQPTYLEQQHVSIAFEKYITDLLQHI